MPETRTGRGRHRPPHRKLHIVLWSIGGLVALLVVAAGWVGVRGWLAYQHLRDAQTAVEDLDTSTLLSSALAGDTADLQQTVDDVSDDVSRAAALTSDPVWRAAEVLPWIGPNLGAFREATGSFDDALTKGVEPFLSAIDGIQLDSLLPQDGRVSADGLQQLDAAAPSLSAASDGIAAADDRAAAIDTTDLADTVSQKVETLQTALDSLASVSRTVASVSQLLPSALGTEGSRNYLLLFLNNAELRAQGGIVGSLAVLHTDDGAITLTEQASSSDFPEDENGVMSLPDDVRAIYGLLPAQYIQDVTLVPNFSLTGELAQAMWQKQYGETVDGVLALDPVTLGYLLQATGSIDVEGVTITSDNAAQQLLNEIYIRETNPKKQDAFFEAAAAAVFQKMTAGGFDASTFVQGLVRGISENRVHLWEADAGEQALLDGSSLAGGLPVSDTQTTRLSAYLNDGTGAKMSYYVEPSTTVTASQCTADGKASEFTVTITLTSTAPSDIADYPSYLTGGGVFGVTPGIVRTLVQVYPSPGFDYVGGSVDAPSGGGLSLASNGDYVLARTSVDLASGESATISVTYRANSPASTTVELGMTPTVNGAVTQQLVAACENG